MIFYVILGMIAALVATVLPFVLYRLSLNPLPILYLFMIATVINALTVSPVPIRLGLNLYLFDLICLLSLACFALRLFQGNILSLFEPAALLIIILTISLFRGLSGYGTQAGVDYRIYIHALTAMLLFSTCDLTPKQLSLIRRAWILMAVALTLIAFQRWAVDLFGIPIERYWEGVGAQNKIRVLGSGDALAIAMGALAVLAGGTRQAGFKNIALGNVLLLTVVVLQHRSVWVSILVGGVMLALFAKQARPMLFKQLLASAIAIPVAFGIAAAAGMDISVLTESIAESTETAIKGEGTVKFREVGWQGLLEGYGRAQTIDKLLGAPMGSGYLRFTRGIYDPRVQVSPHNFYIQVLLRGGILGIFLFMVALAVAGWRAIRTARRSGSAISHWLAATVFMSAAFFVPYGAFLPTGLGLGLAQARVRRDDLPAPAG